ncbi:flagellar protein export ATPase FliI [Thermovenabulum gondwanense]|uniref:Putative ATP synthase YscN n=1 Tax=Thermovenabulum gondwanense TaxID=520767 RepID=A0A161Q9X0_9FIRM|nr:flagellar protein export ATPase FliI [Thermovenabulum gondwanense]KYO64588.1 putative ATP synthase YscN [Thermovenabulum gondwanense]
MIEENFEFYRKIIANTETIRPKGKISKIVGLTMEAEGPIAEIGELCEISPYYSKESGKSILAEVVGFNEDKIILMPLADIESIGPGWDVIALGEKLSVPVGENLLGRILDGLGNPIDGKGPIKNLTKYPLNNNPPNPVDRKPIKEPLTLGVRAIDALLTCGKGQRIGIFAGSGVGKSTLLGMIARNSKADINVIALIGERGRELNSFIQKDLGEEGLRRSVVVVATSDNPPLIRTKGAFTATAIAEYFRDQGMDVMLMMDSITRFAMAQREVGLSAGEPPVSRGYTPSVFAVLPKLLERAGRGKVGSITGIYTVLVDGDDFNEPISDAVRGILDGHIVLSRTLANMNFYPAIDVLSSISRLMDEVITEEHRRLSLRVKNILSVYKEAEELINIGAYKKGTNPKIDEALRYIDRVNNFLKQEINEKSTFEETFALLKDIFSGDEIE